MFVLVRAAADLGYTEEVLGGTVKSGLKGVFNCGTRVVLVVNNYADAHIRAYPAVLGGGCRYLVRRVTSRCRNLESAEQFLPASRFATECGVLVRDGQRIAEDRLGLGLPARCPRPIFRQQS